MCKSHAAINTGAYTRPAKAQVIIKSIGLLRFIVLFILSNILLLSYSVSRKYANHVQNDDSFP